jgi:hypothetical protein
MKQSGHKAWTLILASWCFGLTGCQSFQGFLGLTPPQPIATEPVQGPQPASGVEAAVNTRTPSAPVEAQRKRAQAQDPSIADQIPQWYAATLQPGLTPGAEAIPASVNPADFPAGNITRYLGDTSLPPSQVAQRNSRRWQLAHELRDAPGWNLFESENYFIATPIDDPVLIEGAKRRLDALRERLMDDLPMGPTTEGERPVLRFLEDRAAFDASGARPGTTAQWNASENTLICFDAGTEAERAANTWPGLQHVLVHEYLSSTFVREPAPSWLLYGLAARYEALRFDATPEGGVWREADTEVLARALSEAVAVDSPMPLRRLLEFTPQEFFGVNEYGSGAYRNLILSRSFVSFCWSGANDSEAQAPNGFLKTLVASLARGEEPTRALDRARRDASLESIELAWRGWIEKSTGRPLPDGF